VPQTFSELLSAKSSSEVYFPLLALYIFLLLLLRPYTLFFIFILRLHNDAFTFYNVYICMGTYIQEKKRRKEGGCGGGCSSQYLALLRAPFLKQGKNKNGRIKAFFRSFSLYIRQLTYCFGWFVRVDHKLREEERGLSQSRIKILLS